ncbi:hypothetical protein ACFP3I_11520 [Chryseobacterium arachidis]|uniref:hypothetical protein n=1 Tax=Chryseobacterium arachidis TaxID=1416778 RepID=UPI003617795C
MPRFIGLIIKKSTDSLPDYFSLTIYVLTETNLNLAGINLKDFGICFFTSAEFSYSLNRLCSYFRFKNKFR